MTGSSSARMLFPNVEVSAPVAEAIAAGAPIVALETTILSHGLPWPVNHQTGLACEAAVCAQGAIPASLGIRQGRILVGLSEDQLLAFCDDRRPTTKVNPSNLAAVLASGGDGSLTVAACIQVCARIGIRVFATGGIGGVHRGWTSRPDISADLTHLARWPVVTVCAGAKSILDLPATLEALETLGVPVLGWHTECFPRFHVPTSDLAVDQRVDSGPAVAQIAHAHWDLGGGGILVAAPVPAGSAVDSAALDSWIIRAQQAALQAGITGRGVTPFLLHWLAENSDGACLRANKALVVNNCGVAATISLAMGI